MMGTLAGALAKKRIRTFQDRYEAIATGDIEAVEGVLKITRIHVAYRLKLPPHKQADAQEAFDNYLIHCPAAQSVIEAIDITHELNIEDGD